MSKKEPALTKSPKLTVPEIIDYCKNELGITFNLMDEEMAKEFLKKNNFFFRLKQYCSTCPEQTKSGKYVGLDFGHLVELSTIDMFLRKLLLKMTIDLEHYLKVKLVNDCQNNPADNGYEVVEKFLEILVPGIQPRAAPYALLGLVFLESDQHAVHGHILKQHHHRQRDQAQGHQRPLLPQDAEPFFHPFPRRFLGDGMHCRCIAHTHSPFIREENTDLLNKLLNIDF